MIHPTPSTSPGFLLALLAALGLLFVPGVGAVQASLTAVILAGGWAWWRTASVRGEPISKRSKWGLTALVLGMWGASATMFVDVLFWLDSFRRLEPWWLLFCGVLLPMSVLWRLRRHEIPRGVARQAILLGLLTGAAWAPLGVIDALEGMVRWHPQALLVLALTSAILFGFDTFRRSSDAARLRGRLFLTTQAFAVLVYCQAVDEDPKISLGYVVSHTEATSSDGRLTAHVSRERGETVVWVHDSKTEDVVEAARFWGARPPIQITWSGQVLEVVVFRAIRRETGGCGAEARGPFLQDSIETTTFAPCMESTRPLMCHMDVRGEYQHCTEHIECESQKCELGYCTRSELGGACSSDNGCLADGACVGRVCRARDEGICDSRGDCEAGKYCVRRPDLLLGACYEGDKGDPCETNDHCEYGFLCEGATKRGAGACVADPNAIFF